MTYRIRNILIAVGLALLAMLLTLFYVTNYKRSVQHSTTGVQIYVAVRDLTAGTAGAAGARAAGAGVAAGVTAGCARGVVTSSAGM